MGFYAKKCCFCCTLRFGAYLLGLIILVLAISEVTVFCWISWDYGSNKVEVNNFLNALLDLFFAIALLLLFCWEKPKALKLWCFLKLGQIIFFAILTFIFLIVEWKCTEDFENWQCMFIQLLTIVVQITLIVINLCVLYVVYSLQIKLQESD